MPEITFTVDENGETKLHIEGIKGAGCKPIEAAISADLATLGIGVAQSVDTAEMRQQPTVTRQQNVRVR